LRYRPRPLLLPLNPEIGMMVLLGEIPEWAKRMDFYMEGVNILMRSAKGKPGYDYLSKIHDGLFGISGDFMIMFCQYTRAMEKRKARKEASNLK